MLALFAMIKVNLFRTPKVLLAAFSGKIEEQFNTMSKSKNTESEEEVMLEESWPHI